MSQYTRLITLMAGTSLLLASCQNNGSKEESTSTTTSVTDTAAVKPAPVNVSVVDAPASPEYKDAQLSIASVNAEPQGTDSVKVSFTFNVKNYELKSQTADAGSKQCNNSDKGQHIHFILDNKPYTALYEPKHEVVLPKGGEEHYLMTFLSRSYHESVKSKGAAAIYHFKIDEKGKLQKLADPKTPMVFYSRPKGDYIGKANTDNVLLDYYVWNAKIGDKGYNVRADIRYGDTKTSSMTDGWKAQFIKGLPMGKTTVTLVLIGKDGQPVTGPNTEVTREINLAADEPIK